MPPPCPLEKRNNTTPSVRYPYEIDIPEIKVYLLLCCKNWYTEIAMFAHQARLFSSHVILVLGLRFA